MWLGEMTMSRSGLVFHGAVGTTELHMYHWVKLLTADKGDLVLANAAGNMVSCRAAVIPPGVPHVQVRGTPTGKAIILPPESAAGSELARMASPPDSPEAWARAGAAVVEQIDNVEHWSKQLLLSPAQSAALLRHPAVNKALRLLPSRIQEGTVRLRDISKEVGLSESRFAHLFSAQVGMAFRPYVRCLRVTRAVELVVQGHSLTDAAHEAKFADSSHLNRACHLSLGIAPTVLTSRFHITLEA